MTFSTNGCISCSLADVGLLLIKFRSVFFFDVLPEGRHTLRIRCWHAFRKQWTFIYAAVSNAISPHVPFPTRLTMALTSAPKLVYSTAISDFVRLASLPTNILTMKSRIKNRKEQRKAAREEEKQKRAAWASRKQQSMQPQPRQSGGGKGNKSSSDHQQQKRKFDHADSRARSSYSPSSAAAAAPPRKRSRSESDSGEASRARNPDRSRGKGRKNVDRREKLHQARSKTQDGFKSNWMDEMEKQGLIRGKSGGRSVVRGFDGVLCLPLNKGRWK